MSTNNKKWSFIFKRTGQMGLLLSLSTISILHANDFCQNKECIDLSIKELESISHKTKSSHEFFYLTPEETIFFANIPKVEGCGIDGQFFPHGRDQFQFPAVSVSTTRDCFVKLQAAKKDLDEKKLWTKETAVEMKVKADENVNQYEIQLIRKNSENLSDIADNAWHEPESFKMDTDNIRSNNDHFIYSESLIEKFESEQKKEANLAELIAELDGYSETIDACIATVKTQQNVAAASGAIKDLEDDLKEIMDRFNVSLEESEKLSSLDSKIKELSNKLNIAQQNLKESEFEDEVKVIEESIKKEKSAEKALDGVDKLEKLSKKYPQRKDELRDLQVKMVERAVTVSQSSNYMLVIDKLDELSYQSSFEEDFIENKIAETFKKAAVDMELDSTEGEILLDASKERLYAAHENGNVKNSELYFEASLGLANTVYLTDEINAESASKVEGYVRTLADMNKGTNRKNSETINQKIAEVYALDISTPSVAQMNRSLKMLKAQRALTDDDLFNIYRGTAQMRVQNMETTGVNLQSYAELHGLMSSIPTYVSKMTLEQRMAFSQDYSDLSAQHLTLLSNVGDKKFGFYYNKYQNQLLKDYQALGESRVKVANRSPKKQKLSKEEVEEKLGMIDAQMETIQTIGNNNIQTAQNHQLVIQNLKMEAQKKAIAEQQARMEAANRPIVPGNQTRTNEGSVNPGTPPPMAPVSRSPSLSTGDGMIPNSPVQPTGQTAPTINSGSIFNGVRAQELQTPLMGQ